MRPLLAFAAALWILARAVERGIERGFVAVVACREDPPLI